MPFSEVDKEFDPSKLSPEMQRTYLAAQNANRVSSQEAKSTFEKDIRARYKIEIKFEQNRTTAGLNKIMWQVFESGKHLHGGGDELLYWCQSRKGDEGCKAPISGSSIFHGRAYCSNCKALVNAELLTAQFFCVTYVHKLGDYMANLWRTKLDCSADIYVKFHPDDWRYKAMELKIGADRARELQGLLIYPLANILKDTAAGASLTDQFTKFFKA
jgi:hypothetical protein